MDYSVREMTIDDYGEVYHLWEQTEGLSLEEGDSRDAIKIYLRRNQGFCFVACVQGRVVGTVLCGHKGRRGILRHLAVTRECRGKGIARGLINHCPPLRKTASGSATRLSWTQTFRAVASGSTWDGTFSKTITGPCRFRPRRGNEGYQRLPSRLCPLGV
jgi:predicted N-acetyltransferase YhbS